MGRQHYRTNSETHKVTRTVALTVNKATVTGPTIASKTYNGTTQTATVPDSSLYTVTTNIGGTAVGEYDVVLTLTDANNYKWTDSNEAAKTFKFKITKATAPEVTVPTLDEVTYDPNKTLADITLPDGWAWGDDTITPTVAINGYAAILTVDDNNFNYSGVEGYDSQSNTVTRTVPLTVNKATVTGPTIASKIYNGEKQTATVPVDSLYTVTTNNGGTAVGSYDVVLTLADANNYKWTGSDEAAKTFKFWITKAMAPVITVPTLDEVTYNPNKTLADITLPTGWAWVDGTTVPTVVNNGYDAVLTVDYTNYDYSNVEGFDTETNKVKRTVELTVNKATITGPTIASKIYNGENQTATVPESTLYTVTTNEGGTTVGSYDVVLTLTDTNNYKWIDSDEAAKTFNFSITQATAPEITVPTLEAVTYDPNKKLADITLPDDWAWVDGTTIPTVGNTGYNAALTVDYTNYDYSSVEGYDTQTNKVIKTVALTVNKATVTGPTIASKVYNGENQTATVPDSSLYTVTTNIGGTTVGSYDVVLTLTDTNNYKWTDSDEAAKTFKFWITKATAPEITVPTLQAVTYDPNKTLADITLPTDWAWVDGTTVPTVVNNGYDAVLTVDDNNYNYNDVEGYEAQNHTVKRTVTLTVNKANSTTATVTGVSTTYDGNYKALVNVTGNAVGGDMMYALGTNNTTAPTDDWSKTIPTKKNSGTYYIWYKVSGDTNHNDTEPGIAEATISPKTLSVNWPEEKEGKIELIYNGKSQAPTATLVGVLYCTGKWSTEKCKSNS